LDQNLSLKIGSNIHSNPIRSNGVVRLNYKNTSQGDAKVRNDENSSVWNRWLAHRRTFNTNTYLTIPISTNQMDWSASGSMHDVHGNHTMEQQIR
jgi:hypothetical protein